MKRILTIGYATDGQFRFQSGEVKPQIRIANRWLLRSNFKAGDKAEVEYSKELITIRKQQKT